MRVKVTAEQFAARINGHRVSGADVFQDNLMTIFQIRISGGSVLNIVSGKSTTGEDIHVPQFWVENPSVVSVPAVQRADEMVEQATTTVCSGSKSSGYTPYYSGFEEEEQ